MQPDSPTLANQLGDASTSPQLGGKTERWIRRILLKPRKNLCLLILRQTPPGAGVLPGGKT
jgi:hypothetical protein